MMPGRLWRIFVFVILASDLLGGLALAASPRRLRNIRVGEHKGFSRLVLDLSARADYSLDFAGEAMEFALALREVDYAELLPHYVQIPENSLVEEIFLEQNQNAQTVLHVKLAQRSWVKDFELDSPYKLVVDIFPINTTTTSPQQSLSHASVALESAPKKIEHHGGRNSPERTLIKDERGIALSRSEATVPLPSKDTEASIDSSLAGTRLQKPNPANQAVRPKSPRPDGLPLPLKTLVIVVLITTLVVNTLLVLGFKLGHKVLASRGTHTDPRPKTNSEKKADQDKTTFAGHLLSSYAATEELFAATKPETSARPAPALHAMVSDHDFTATASSAMPDTLEIPPLLPSPTHASAPSRPSQMKNDKSYKEALRLARQNWEVPEIAKKLQLSKDEVSLLLNLAASQSGISTAKSGLRLALAD